MKKNSGLYIIEGFIKKRIGIFNKATATDAESITGSYENVNIKLSKILPRSILDSLDLRENAYDKKKQTKKHIKTRIAKLKKFKANNEAQPKPWKYASKQKIDLILEYLHHNLLYDVYAEKGVYSSEEDKETFLRHNFFNVDSYDVAREYFRFFGRYEKGTITDAKGYGKENFVMPKQITNLKDKYKLVFSYINSTISKANSLEELYEAVINGYIDKLECLQKNYSKFELDDLRNVLKLKDKQSKEHINELLNNKEHKQYLASFSLPHEIIDVKKILKNKWNKFKVNKKSKLKGKEFNCSEFSFIRQKLQGKDTVTTNIDYIFQHILTKVEAYKDKKLPCQVYRELLKLKTEELILWNIAKTYWKKANGEAPYDLEKLGTNEDCSSYQIYTSFNKVYKQELDYKIEVSGYNENKFKTTSRTNEKIGNGTIINIKVPARRYDNVFLKYEKELIQDYVLFNHFDKYNAEKNEIILPKEYEYKKNDGKIRIYNLQNFDDLMKVIYRDLKKSLDGIYDLLRAERKIVKDVKFETENVLKNKYEDKDKIEGFYIPFSYEEDKKTIDTELLEAFLNKIDEKNVNKKTVTEYLKQYRNNALHYQLQDPNRKKEIEQLLNSINSNTELLENDKDDFVDEE